MDVKMYIMPHQMKLQRRIMVCMHAEISLTMHAHLYDFK